MKFISIFVLVLFCMSANAQKHDYHWVFGDSVGINFNANPPTIDTTRIIMSNEPSASISDVNGNLLFYVGSPQTNQSLPGSKKYEVRNALDSIMPGCDSLNGHTSMTQGLLIVNDPGDSLKYYIFHKGDRLCYSVIDMSLNNGLGGISSLNNSLKYNVLEKLHAVKAANGKDWWVVGMRQDNFYYYLYKYKVDSTGITYQGEFAFGNVISSSGIGQMVFSQIGDRLIYSGGIDKSYLFDFDRCTGVFSNPVVIESTIGGGGTSERYGASFSGSGQFGYLSSLDSIWQFDLNAPNIISSKQLIFAVAINSSYLMGQHMLAPDGKIYIANTYSVGSIVPYDSLNSHLTVINEPDSSGAPCNIAPYSFSLQGRRCLVGLPNMVNYNLGVLEGVNCDSILAADVIEFKDNLHYSIYPNPASETVNIIVSGNKLNNFIEVELLSIDGKLIENYYLEKYFSELSIDVSNIEPGMYLLQFKSGKEYIRVSKLMISKQ